MSGYGWVEIYSLLDLREGQSHAVCARERTPRLTGLLWKSWLPGWLGFLWPGAGKNDEIRADRKPTSNGWFPIELVSEDVMNILCLMVKRPPVHLRIIHYHFPLTWWPCLHLVRIAHQVCQTKWPSGCYFIRLPYTCLKPLKTSHPGTQPNGLFSLTTLSRERCLIREAMTEVSDAWMLLSNS